MRIRHPRALDGEPPGIAVDVNGEHVLPDEHGHYDIGDARGWLEQFAAANGCDPGDLLISEDRPPDDGKQALAVDPGDLTVADLRDAVADIDDVGDLEAVRAVEADGKNRTTALEAIDDRLDTLHEG